MHQENAEVVWRQSEISKTLLLTDSKVQRLIGEDSSWALCSRGPHRELVPQDSFHHSQPSRHLRRLLQPCSKGTKFLLQPAADLAAIHMVLIFQACRMQELWGYGGIYTDFLVLGSQKKCTTESWPLPGAHKQAVCEAVREKLKVQWEPQETEDARNVPEDARNSQHTQEGCYGAATYKVMDMGLLRLWESHHATVCHKGWTCRNRSFSLLLLLRFCFPAVFWSCFGLIYPFLTLPIGVEMFTFCHCLLQGLIFSFYRGSQLRVYLESERKLWTWTLFP